MVEPILYSASGFLLATLLWLLFLPAFWRRAVRVTRSRLIANLPVSAEAIIASQDRLRAEHAVAMRSAERRAERAVASLDSERVAAARARASELGMRADIDDLKEKIAAIEDDKARLIYALETATADERKSAETVLAATTARDNLAAEVRAMKRVSDAAEFAAGQARSEAATLRGQVTKLEARVAPIWTSADNDGQPSLMARPKERAEA